VFDGTLEQRLAELIGGHLHEDLRAAANSCIDAATNILRRIAAVEQPGRESPEGARATAVDLLAADALITIACELAADGCESFDAETAAWSSRIAALAPQKRD